jgi:hypothetical protein
MERPVRDIKPIVIASVAENRRSRVEASVAISSRMLIMILHFSSVYYETISIFQFFRRIFKIIFDKLAKYYQKPTRITT